MGYREDGEHGILFPEHGVEGEDVLDLGKHVPVAEFYEDTNVEIPVEVELLGRDTSLDHTFIFNVDGYGDDGQLSVDPIELSKAEDYKGKFVIPADKFSNAANNYYLSVYQTIGNDANIEYDSNISTIKLGVMYLNGQKLFTYEWGEFDDEQC